MNILNIYDFGYPFSEVITQEEADVILDAYIEDGTYPIGTFDKFIKDKYPGLYRKVLPIITARKLLR